jgi:hypothetical protein
MDKPSVGVKRVGTRSLHQLLIFDGMIQMAYNS